MDLLSFPENWRSGSIERLEKDLKSKSEQFWVKRGEVRALNLFHQMARRVPAYKDFLKKHKFDPGKVKSITDFKNIPPVDKQNYLKKYSLEKLCWDGKLADQQFIYSSTSGTTGEPFYFPRTEAQSQQYALTAELYLRNNFQIHKKSTLYVDGFAMGAWIGGLFTYEAIRIIADKGYKISIITPGTNIPEILKAIRQLAPKYDQVILGGYPPFIKDTIDAGLATGLKWKNYNLGIIFSAEGFNEKFRDYIVKHAGLKNVYTSTLNHYGTVDQGTHSHETPLAILLRRLSDKTATAHRALFPEANRMPTLTQYLPEQFYFEAVNGNLYCSAFSGLPLVRYDLKDRGGVFSRAEVEKALKFKASINLSKEIKKAGIGHTLWNLPFVYLYERSDMVVSWYGANIYPEHIRTSHLHPSVSSSLTGKFTMQVEHNKQHDPVLQVNVELRDKVKPKKALANKLKVVIMDTLRKWNSEYKNNLAVAPAKNIPTIKLWPHQSHPHFKSGGKQKWVIK